MKMNHISKITHFQIFIFKKLKIWQVRCVIFEHNRFWYKIHFYINGIGYWQNYFFWRLGNLCPWCDFLAESDITTFFFEINVGETISVSGLCYHNVIIQFLIPKL